jgi:CheY-like chemotaxis protein
MDTMEETMPAARPRRSEGQALEGIRVLVVDDDTDVRESLQMLLELYGAEVSGAASAEAAMAAFERSRPDVLMCDISMPGADGYDLMRRIASRDPSLPAAALTALADPSGLARARAAGFSVQLVKPIEAAALVAVVLELAAIPS